VISKNNPEEEPVFRDEHVILFEVIPPSRKVVLFIE